MGRIKLFFCFLLVFISSDLISQNNKVPVEPSETWLNKQHQPEKLMDAIGLKKGMTIVTTFLGQVDNPMLPDGEADIAFMVSTYHHLDEPVEMIRNTIPALKKNGILVIVERDPVKTGQTGSESTSREKLTRQANEAGFVLDRVNTELLERDNIYFLKVKK